MNPRILSESIHQAGKDVVVLAKGDSRYGHSFCSPTLC